MRAIITFGLSAALTSISAAQTTGTFSGNDMLKIMNGAAGQHALLMYVRGALDMMILDGEVAAESGIRLKYRFPICAPAAATTGQAADVVKMFIDKNPDKRHLSMLALTTMALHLAWPCEKNG